MDESGVFLIDVDSRPTDKLSGILRDLVPVRLYAPERLAYMANELGKSLNVAIKTEPGLRGWSADRVDEGEDRRADLKRFSTPGWSSTPVPGGGEPFREYQLRVLTALNGLLDAYDLYKRSLAVLGDRRTLQLVEAWLSAGKGKVGRELTLRDDLPAGAVLRVYKERDGRWCAERFGCGADTEAVPEEPEDDAT